MIRKPLFLALLLVMVTRLSAEEAPETVLPPSPQGGPAIILNPTTQVEQPARVPYPAPSQTVELPSVDASALREATHQTTAVEPQHIEVKPGVNELMPIAVSHLNRLVTPFDNPVVTTTSQATTSTKGRIVYVATADETPVTLYITPGDNQDIALSLTLIPKRIPAREIHLTLDTRSYKTLTKLQQSATSASVGKKGDQEQDHIARLKKIFRDLGLQRSSAGFALREPVGGETITCTQPGLNTRTGQTLEGQDLLILVGVARNGGGDPLELDERACSGARGEVLAVAAWPKVVLGPGEATELYVALRRVPEEASSARPSLLGGGVR